MELNQSFLILIYCRLTCCICQSIIKASMRINGDLKEEYRFNRCIKCTTDQSLGSNRGVDKKQYYSTSAQPSIPGHVVFVPSVTCSRVALPCTCSAARCTMIRTSWNQKHQQLRLCKLNSVVQASKLNLYFVFS